MIAERQGDLIGVAPTIWADGAGHWSDGGSFGDLGNLVLKRDGVTIATSIYPHDVFTVPSGDATYELTLNTEKVGAPAKFWKRRDGLGDYARFGERRPVDHDPVAHTLGHHLRLHRTGAWRYGNERCGDEEADFFTGVLHLGEPVPDRLDAGDHLDQLADAAAGHRLAVFLGEGDERQLGAAQFRLSFADQRAERDRGRRCRESAVGSGLHQAGRHQVRQRRLDRGRGEVQGVDQLGRAGLGTTGEHGVDRFVFGAQAQRTQHRRPPPLHLLLRGEYAPR
ncbi:hypothetical protein ACGFI9_32305 [Micromonospora sp. NPDC048930]|uniref:hypothetical protein n=1 Tax=Micromonospora sp. NPDC048930 TaxID=3364261 RepID=UPI00371D2F47